MLYGEACQVAASTWNYSDEELAKALDVIESKRGRWTQSDLYDMTVLRETIADRQGAPVASQHRRRKGSKTLHYVIRNAQGHFYSHDNNYFLGGLNNATIFLHEETAIGWAQLARASYPEAGVKVSAFSVEFSDI